jgi:hypothetical protein
MTPLALPRHPLSTALVALLALAPACSTVGDPGAPAPEEETTPETPAEETPPGPTSSGEDNTFDHPDAAPDIWQLLQRMQEEGPPRYTARVHACPKLRYAAIGRLLASRGVDLGATGELTAGAMWRSSDQALGAANYAARSRENPELTTASASKLFDIFVQAAPEIIANLPSRPECTVAGVGARMFSDLGHCMVDGISCLIGVPAKAGHVDLCNEMVQRASTPEAGRAIAVATLLAAAHTCE